MGDEVLTGLGSPTRRAGRGRAPRLGARAVRSTANHPACARLGASPKKLMPLSTLAAFSLDIALGCQRMLAKVGQKSTACRRACVLLLGFQWVLLLLFWAGNCWATEDAATRDAGSVTQRLEGGALSSGELDAAGDAASENSVSDAGSFADGDASLDPDAGLSDASVSEGGQADAESDAGTREAREAGVEESEDAGAVVRPLPGTGPPAKPPSVEQAGGVVAKTVLGLALFILLAYLGAHPRVRRWEDRLGVTNLITAGFPFIALGVIAQHTGVLTPGILVELTPLLQFGLGWIGFMVGMRFNVRFLERVPRGTSLAVALVTSLPFTAIALSCGALMVLFSGGVLTMGLVRDAIILGTAGAMTSPRIGCAAAQRVFADPEADLPRRIGQLDEIAAVVGLALLGAYFRPENVRLSWEINGAGWLFIAVGMGFVIGLVVYTTLNLRTSNTEFLAVTLGSVAFAAGMAGYLHVSPLVVCFVAGALVANLPFRHTDRLWETLALLERPILLVFLGLTGVLWDVTKWHGWVLVVVFVAARILGKHAALSILRLHPEAEKAPLDREARLVLAPMSVLGIAIVLGAQSMYPGSSLSWIVTAVIGGSLTCEVAVQLSRSRKKATSTIDSESAEEGVAP